MKLFGKKKEENKENVVNTNSIFIRKFTCKNGI